MNPNFTYFNNRHRGLYNKTLGILWIDVPKCASTWARSFMAKVGGFEPVVADYYPSNCSNVIGIARDPIQRFISASMNLSQDLHQCQSMLETMTSNELESLVVSRFRDTNLAPQHPHFGYIDISQTQMFWLDKNLTSNFIKYFQKFGVVIEPKDCPTLNASIQHDGYYTAIQTIWRQVLKKLPDHHEALRRAYNLDYQWIQTLHTQGKFFDSSANT